MFQESFCSSNTWKTLCFFKCSLYYILNGMPFRGKQLDSCFSDTDWNPDFFSPEFFPHSELDLGSWLCLRLLTQSQLVRALFWETLGIDSNLFPFNRRIISAEGPKLSPCLLCCNLRATEKSLLQGGINPLLCPIQTQGLPLCCSFQIPKAFFG